MLGRPLQVTGASRGLVSFELAYDEAALQSVFAAWGELGRARAALMTWIDFLFLAAYGSALSCVSFQVNGALRFPRIARAAAWAATAAALLDFFENGLGLALLAGVPALPAAPLMAFCAALKFTLVLLPLTWAPAGLFICPPREL